jgi:hypothetical protein
MLRAKLMELAVRQSPSFLSRKRPGEMPGLHQRKMTPFKGLSAQKSFVTTGAGFQGCAKYPSPPWVCLGQLAKNNPYLAPRITGLLGSFDEPSLGAATVNEDQRGAF